MSSGCGDVLSLEDLKTAKKHQTFEAEVITGHAGGVASGASIDYATNQVTGQVQKTMPAILRDMGFDPASFDFTTGGTVTERDTVVYNPADNNWYSWSGSLPHVIAPGTDPTADANWKPRTDQLLRQELYSSTGFSMVQGLNKQLQVQSLQDWINNLGGKDISLEQGGTVETADNIIYVRNFGASGDGTDQTAEIQAAFDFWKENPRYEGLAFDTGGTYLINSSQVKVPYVDGYLTGKRLKIFFNGATIRTNGPYQAFAQYTSPTASTVSDIKYGFLIFSPRFEGYANRDSVWSVVNKAMGWSFAYGAVYNAYGNNLNKVLTAHGRTIVYNTIAGDQIRDSVYSCYVDPKDSVTGSNAIFNTQVTWCSGDAHILKGPDVYMDGLTYRNVGCIQATNQDEINKKAAGGPGEPRGVPVSVGADIVSAKNVTILNVTGDYVGAGGLSLNGENITVGGVQSYGSHWTDNFVASLTGPMLWLNVTNSQIGNVKAKDIFSGVGINAGTSDLQMGKFSARSKMAMAGATLFSATDSSSAAIERVDIEGIYLHGASTINNDVYLNTAGITVGEIYISQLNNTQGGFTVEFARACTVKKLRLIATTSSATNTNVRISANARIDDLEIERTFGTAVLIQSDIAPQIGKITLRNKQGTLPPIDIKGTGTIILNFGNVVITGPTTASPKLNGSLTMEGYTGPAWKINTVGVTANVTFPTKTTTAVST